MKNAKRIVAMTLVTALCLFSFVLTGSTEAIAEYTPTLSMLHTSGKYIYNEENEWITLRGTNLGGWLMQEGWMTPLGSGEIDHNFIVNITASDTNGNNIAAYASDTVTENGLTTNNMNTYWQSTSAQAADSAELLIEFDKTRYFDRIVVETGPNHTGDYLRGAVVWMSNNWTDWFSPASITVDESKASEGIITVLTGEQSAKYIAIRPGRASEDGQYWTVANISLCMTDEYNVRNHLIRRFGESRTNEMIATFQENYITEADIINIANMNMNFVRVPVYWMDFALKDGTLRTDADSGFARLDWLLEVCDENGIYVLIDFHGAPGGVNCWASCGQASTIPTELYAGDPDTVEWNQSVVLNIWSALATRYKDNPTVAAYGLLNEPVLNFDTNPAYENLKYGFYDEIYDTVRAIDNNHIVIFEEFMDWSVAANRPERQTWTNYMFDKHPYDMPNYLSWDAQKSLANNTVSTMSQIQDQWNVPLIVGEFCLYYFSDVWDDFLSDLNENSISWTNWNYKVRGTIYESGGGNWGYYNTWDGEDPDLMHDSANEIEAIWAATGTASHYQANEPHINIVSARADGSTNHPYVALDRSSWVVSANGNPQWPYDPVSNMIDGSLSTRWTTGEAQTAGHYVLVDFGQTENFDKIVLEHDANDYPGSYKVEISQDGAVFTEVELNNIHIGFGPKMVLLPSTPQTSRYVKISLTGPNPIDNWWSICELNILWRNVHG